MTQPLSGDPLATALRELNADGRASTHYDGCWQNHKGCAALYAADRLDDLRATIEQLTTECDERLEQDFARDQGRDLMADAIDAYMAEGGEFRAYDLADRLTRKLNQGGWWFVHGGDVERMISQEHPFNARMAEQNRDLTAEIEKQQRTRLAAERSRDKALGVVERYEDD